MAIPMSLTAIQEDHYHAQEVNKGNAVMLTQQENRKVIDKKKQLTVKLHYIYVTYCKQDFYMVVLKVKNQ